jgi:hypothetical protein
MQTSAAARFIPLLYENKLHVVRIARIGIKVKTWYYEI